MSDDAARVVLLLEPPVGSSANGACRDLLADDDDPTSVLSVLYGESVEERARRLRSRTDGVASAAFVAVNPTTAPTDVGAVRTVPNPGDLTTVGVAVTEWLTARDAGENPVVCVEGASTMLQYTDVERVFRFLHVARGKCREHGADLHVHLTPSAHDVSAVATLRQVFDEQRRVSSAGPDGEGTQGGAAPIADGVDGTPRGG